MGGRLAQAALIAPASLAAAAALFAGPADAAKSPKPNLKVSKFALAATTVVAGDKVSAADTTANTGTKRAGRTVTAFYLSTDARKDVRDRKLASRPIAALKPHKTSKGKTSLTIPQAQTAGVYRVLACADDRRKVRESSERDNCRAASTALTVSARTAAPQTPGQSTPTDSTTQPGTTLPGTDIPTVQTPSEQIQALRNAADGPVDIVVADAVVTYMKPALGNDAAGFFIQGAQAGPAVFVAVDPSTLNPGPAVGDKVGFTATQMSTLSGLRAVAALTGFARSASGVDVSALKQDVSAVDVVSALDSYESELVGLAGTIASPFAAAGAGHEAAQVATAGDPVASASLKLRVPSTVRDALDLVNGCTFSLNAGPMWRFNAEAQPSAYSASDITPTACPAPTVVSAVAASATSVVVTFDRRIDPASVQTDASQFVADNGLTFSAAAVSGRTVTLTSATQTPHTSYTVTVASTVHDLLGAGVGNPDSALFSGFVTPAILKITEINPNIAASHDLIELTATTGGDTNGIEITQIGSVTDTLVTFPSVTVATGDLLVVHLTPAGATGAAPGSETTSKTEYPAAAYSANYDGAWDIQGNAIGLTFSNRVLRVLSSIGSTIDAVPFALSSLASPPAAFPAALQALQTEGLWLPADCGGAPCTYASTPTAIDVSVDYLGAGTTPGGNSISRKSGLFTKQKSDWNAAGSSTFGLANP